MEGGSYFVVGKKDDPDDSWEEIRHVYPRLAHRFQGQSMERMVSSETYDGDVFSIRPEEFRVESCYVKLDLYNHVRRVSRGYDHSYYKTVYAGVTFYSSRSKQSVDLTENTANSRKKRTFRFPRSQWEDRDLLRRALAQTYFNLKEKEGSEED